MEDSRSQVQIVGVPGVLGQGLFDDRQGLHTGFRVDRQDSGQGGPGWGGPGVLLQGCQVGFVSFEPEGFGLPVGQFVVDLLIQPPNPQI